MKATDKHRRKWDISLSNLERLAKSPMPTFICLLEFNGQEHAKNVYLVHIGEPVIRRVLKRLRQLEKITGQGAKKAVLSITCNDSDRLPEPSGACLREAIGNHVAEGFDKYCQWKMRLLKTLGYEDGFGHIDVTISALPDSDPVKALLDLSLGLRKSVKVIRWTQYDTRFGISCPVALPLKEGGELSITSELLNATVHFREQRSSPSIDFSAKLHNPSVNRVIPRERTRLRLQAQFFDVLLEPFGCTAEFRFTLDGAKTSAKLSDLRNYLRLLHMFHVKGNQGIRMEIAVDGQVLSEGKLSACQFATDPSEELATVEQALALARIYNLERRVSTTVNALMAIQRPINIFYNMVENPSEQLTGTFFTDDPIQVTNNAGAILRTRVPLGGYFLYCVFGIVGRLEEIGEKQYKFVSREKSFHRRMLKEKSQKIDNSELADVIASIQDEMQGVGIDPIITLKEWWGG